MKDIKPSKAFDCLCLIPHNWGERSVNCLEIIALKLWWEQRPNDKCHRIRHLTTPLTGGKEKKIKRGKLLPIVQLYGSIFFMWTGSRGSYLIRMPPWLKAIIKLGDIQMTFQNTIQPTTYYRISLVFKLDKRLYKY